MLPATHSAGKVSYIFDYSLIMRREYYPYSYWIKELCNSSSYNLYAVEYLMCLIFLWVKSIHETFFNIAQIMVVVYVRS